MKGCDVLRAAKQLSYVYEAEPAQVELYCPRIWNPGIFKVEEIVRFPKPFPLSKKPVNVPLVLAKAADNKAYRKRLSEVARTPGQHAVLLVKGVEAPTEPGAIWEVYVGPAGLKPNPKDPSFVGVFGLFGGGVKTRRDHYHPGEFAFLINQAIVAAGDASKLQVTFVPASGVEVQGRAQPAEVRADLLVAEISMVVDVAMPQPAKDEQEKLKREEQME